MYELVPVKDGPRQESVVFSFNGGDGQYPTGVLTPNSAGTEYFGTTSRGGSGSEGTAFQLVPPSSPGQSWAESVIYNFAIVNNRYLNNVFPKAPIVIGRGGGLFLTTAGTGAGGPALGQAIELLPPSASGGTWSENVIYAFSDVPDGALPLSGFVSWNGALFGTTFGGGVVFSCYDQGCGTVYELQPPTAGSSDWTETVLHSFPAFPGDGNHPAAALTPGPNGEWYGTTEYGGTGSCAWGSFNGCGTVFQLIPPLATGGQWTYSVLYSFTGGDGDGAAPVGVLTLGANGVLYGTTSAGGNNTPCPGNVFYGPLPGCGTVFEVVPPTSPAGAWTETILHTFSDSTGDGSIPLAGLIMAPSGVLYGTTSAGGAHGRGTVFELLP